MKLGGLESILLCVIVAGITWFAAGMYNKGQAGGGTGAGLSLAPDVKTYIDASLARAGGGANPCAEVPKLMARIADLQVKLGAIEVYRVNKNLKDTKQQQFLNDAEAIHVRTQTNLAGARANEINRIKEDLGKICIGVPTGPPIPPGRRGRPNAPTPGAEETDDKTGSASEGQ